MPFGALASGLFRAFAPRILQEGAEYGAARAVGKATGRRVSSFLAGQQGQRAVGQVAGARFASSLATQRGQRVTEFLAARSTRQAARGATDREGGPKPTKAAEQPTTQDLNLNLIQDTAMANRAASGQRIPRQAIAGRGWMGTGKGWWEQNEQVSQQQNADVSKLGDFSVARGPSSWVLPGAGMARRIGAGIVGFQEGKRAYGELSRAAAPSAPSAASSSTEAGRYGFGAQGPETLGTSPTEGTGETVGPSAFRRASFSQGAGNIQDAEVFDPTLRNVRTVSQPPATYESPQGTYTGRDPRAALSAFEGGGKTASSAPKLGGGGQHALGPGPRALGPGEPPTGTTSGGQGYFEFPGVSPPNTKRRYG